MSVPRSPSAGRAAPAPNEEEEAPCFTRFLKNTFEMDREPEEKEKSQHILSLLVKITVIVFVTARVVILACLGLPAFYHIDTGWIVLGVMSIFIQSVGFAGVHFRLRFVSFLYVFCDVIFITGETGKWIAYLTMTNYLTPTHVAYVIVYVSLNLVRLLGGILSLVFAIKLHQIASAKEEKEQAEKEEEERALIEEKFSERKKHLKKLRKERRLKKSMPSTSDE